MFNKILGWFKSNKAATSFLVAAALVLIGGFAMQGCSLGGYIYHDVPKDMQSHNDGEPRVSLNDAPFVLESYISDVERNVERFSSNNDKAHLIFDFMSSLSTVGLDLLENSGVPGAGMLSLGLVGLSGLMIRKPGTAREVAKEKEASFNKGQDIALEKLQAFVQPDQLKSLIAALTEGGA